MESNYNFLPGAVKRSGVNFMRLWRNITKANTTQALNDPQLSSLAEICEAKLTTSALKNEQAFFTHMPWPVEKKHLKKQIYERNNLLQGSVRAVMLTTRVKPGCVGMEEEAKFRV